MSKYTQSFQNALDKAIQNIPGKIVLTRAKFVVRYKEVNSKGVETKKERFGTNRATTAAPKYTGAFQKSWNLLVNTAGVVINGAAFKDDGYTIMFRKGNKNRRKNEGSFRRDQANYSSLGRRWKKVRPTA